VKKAMSQRGRRRRQQKKEKHFGHLATFWFGTFAVIFCATEFAVYHENT